MDIDITQIETRLKVQLETALQKADRALIFWEDESGEYRDILGELDLSPAYAIDATSCELKTKRSVLRDHREDSLVLYRAGTPPLPEDDFLYDIKCTAVPFTCKKEGIWASECGIEPGLAYMLSPHATFFRAKERRERLAASHLPKSDVDEVKLAMLAACAGSRADNPRDAVRDVAGRLLTEDARGDTVCYRIICDAELEASLWTWIQQIIGYAAPQEGVPTVEDLAFSMLQRCCEGLLDKGAPTLTNDAIKILHDMAHDARTRKDYNTLVEKYHKNLAALIPASNRSISALKNDDTLPDFDEWILQDMLDRIRTGTLSAKEAGDLLHSRKHTLWFDRYQVYYRFMAAAQELFEQTEIYGSETSTCSSMKALFEAYVQRWYAIDLWYRCGIAAWHAMPGGACKDSLKPVYKRVLTVYDTFLMKLTDKWQAYLPDTESYPPDDIAAQHRFFREKIEIAVPRADAEHRIGLIVSDALRYEVARELCWRLSDHDTKGKLEVRFEAMLSMLPSYTQLGMAALLPAGEMEINPQDETVLKAEMPTQGLENRKKLIQAVYPEALVVQAQDVLDSGMPDTANAPLVVIYHNIIDERGDKPNTESQVFAACEDAIKELVGLTDTLHKAGCKTVLITADHGFIYQDQTMEGFNYIETDGFSDLKSANFTELSYGRRFAVGTILPTCDELMEYTTSELSLAGNTKIALAKGTTRMRKIGSGARYVHGGASLQENVVPIISIKTVKRKSGNAQTGAQGFLTGRAVITGPNVSLEVYQTLPCSDTVSALTVKVGLYAPDDPKKLLCAREETLELASTDAASEARKTRVTLALTGDVDAYTSAILRILERIGNTNQYKSAWEQTLSVNRAFGSDFDF